MATKQLKKNLRACTICRKTTKDVQLCTDPYSLEINNEGVEINLCDLCYTDRVMDI